MSGKYKSEALQQLVYSEGAYFCTESSTQKVQDSTENEHYMTKKSRCVEYIKI